VFECFKHDQRAALAIHLEDNEESLVERSSGHSMAELAKPEFAAEREKLGVGFSCPLRWRAFLALADRISVIYRTLGDFAPKEVAWTELPPVLDMQFFAPREINMDLRLKHGVPEGAAVLCYTGNDHFANRDDVRELYQIIHALNQSGTRTWLLRTGKTDPSHSEGLGFDPESFMTKLGFIERDELANLMSLCDVFVQPGGDDAFNRYRLPAKVPEYLALGKPVVVGPANIAGELEHGVNAWIAGQGSVGEMTAACRTLLEDEALRTKLGKGAREFAMKRFSIESAQPLIAKFYADCASTAKLRLGARGLGGNAFPCDESETAALAAFLRDEAASKKPELPVKPERNDKAAKELEAIKQSWVWKLARPLYSLTRKK
jgi:hypothetical protein